MGKMGPYETRVQAKLDNGNKALSVLQQLLHAMQIVQRGVVLDDEQILDLAEGVLQGTNRPITDPLEAVREIIKYCGDNPDREGLKESPERFLKAMREYTIGQTVNAEEIAGMVKTFEDGSEGYDEMIVQSGISFHSVCEHHFATFWGQAHIGYVANKRIIGLSKLARITEVFARRFQVQERLTVQIADCIQEHLQPLGVAVVLEARHSCIECRGIRKVGSVTTTSALRGVLREKPEARAEFFSIIKNGRK